MFRNLRNYRAAILLLATATQLACDIKDPLEGVNVRLKLDDAPVELDGPILTIVPGQLSEQVKTVTIDEPIESLDEFTGVTLSPSSIAYTPGSAVMAGDMANSSSAASGELGVWVYMKNPTRYLMGARITVVNNTVTAIEPAAVTAPALVNTMKALAQQSIAAVPNSSAILSAAQNLTLAELTATLNALLTSQNIQLGFGVVNLSGNLTGTIQIKNFKIDAEVTM